MQKSFKGGHRSKLMSFIKAPQPSEESRVNNKAKPSCSQTQLEMSPLQQSFLEVWSFLSIFLPVPSKRKTGRGQESTNTVKCRARDRRGGIGCQSIRKSPPQFTPDIPDLMELPNVSRKYPVWVQKGKHPREEQDSSNHYHFDHTFTPSTQCFGESYRAQGC